jgi:virulence-associated protein VagC
LVVVPIDERGRLTIPKEFAVRATRATVIPAGSFLVVVPIPSKPLEGSASWLETKRGRKELKALAEESARRDAARRTMRRKQL